MIPTRADSVRSREESRWKESEERVGSWDEEWMKMGTLALQFTLPSLASPLVSKKLIELGGFCSFELIRVTSTR